MIPAPAAPSPVRTFAAAAVRARQLSLRWTDETLPRQLAALLPCGCYRRFCPFGPLPGGCVGHGRAYQR